MLVYGPAKDEDKTAFLVELHELAQVCLDPWLVCGDFNMIYRAHDKNNDRLNRRRMGRFGHFLNLANLKEIHLEGWLFTWSNECAHPTLKRIDRAFIYVDWKLLFPNHDMHSLSSLCLDHALLLLKV
jgi:hypothetical protein